MLKVHHVNRTVVRVVAAVAVLVAASPAFAAKPQRIVSLNLCTDQILLDLVSRQRIAALSFLAADPTMSSMVEEARGLKTIQGAAEEVLALDPDLVFVGQYSTPATVSLLERLGQRVVKVAMASSFAEIRSVVRHMAEAVGEGPRGDAMIADFDARISAAKALPDSSPPTVMAMQVNSLASGPGTCTSVYVRSWIHKSVQVVIFRIFKLYCFFVVLCRRNFIGGLFLLFPCGDYFKFYQ